MGMLRSRVLRTCAQQTHQVIAANIVLHSADTRTAAHSPNLTQAHTDSTQSKLHIHKHGTHMEVSLSLFHGWLQQCSHAAAPLQTHCHLHLHITHSLTHKHDSDKKRGMLLQCSSSVNTCNRPHRCVGSGKVAVENR